MYKGAIHIIILLCFFTKIAVAKPVKELWANYSTVENSKEKITILHSLHEAYVHENNIIAADSVLDMSIDIAQMSGNDTLLVNVYKTYFKGIEYLNLAEAIEYAKNFLTLASHAHNTEWSYVANAAYAKVMIASGKTDAALDKINRASYYAGLSDNDSLKIDCFLIWGKCLEATNNKVDAFRNYLDALNLAQKHENKAAIGECYNKLSFFYLLIGNYEQAKDYKIKQITLLKNQGITDSLKYMSLLCSLAETYYYNKEKINAEKITKQVVNYASRNNNPLLLDSAISDQRTFLISNGLFKEMAYLYTNIYPDQLQVLAMKDTDMYYRVLAYIYEEKGNIDSSRYYFSEAEKKILGTKGNIYVSNFLKRYAQFLLRTGNAPLAKEKMQASFDYAKQADYLPYLVETSHYLDSMYYAAGNLPLAYKYAKLNKEYSDKQETAIKQDAMLLMEIDNETKQRELITKHEQEHTERRHNVQYMGIIIAILSSFIILVMLGSFKVPKAVIRSMGFFAFIFFFEFIVLILDHKIMEITHHEPWKMLGIKIILIGFMLPFHHWLEHKVTHYLIEHKLVDAAWITGKKFWNRKPEPKAELPDDSEL